MRGVTARNSDTGCNSILNQKYSTLFILVLKNFPFHKKSTICTVVHSVNEQAGFRMRPDPHAGDSEE